MLERLLQETGGGNTDRLYGEEGWQSAKRERPFGEDAAMADFNGQDEGSGRVRAEAKDKDEGKPDWSVLAKIVCELREGPPAALSAWRSLR